MPLVIRWLASKLLWSYCPQLATFSGAYVKDLSDLRLTFAQVDEYRVRFIDQWQNLNLDALLCPGDIPFVAIIQFSRLVLHCLRSK